VGDVRFEKGGGRHVELYGRYKGTFKTHAECAAFVKGVEAVLEYNDRLARGRLSWRPRIRTPNLSSFAMSQGLLVPSG
jgi:hypothetical protein